MTRVSDIRRIFKERLAADQYVTIAGGVKTIEIAPAFFLADEPTIFGEVNRDYVRREIEWYESMSLNVNDIPGGPPEIWKKCATPQGFINSNYGWCIYNPDNGDQYHNVLRELRRDPSSRRAVMIYTRPSMHVDQNRGGMQDFMCTNTVQFFVRDGHLDCLVSMRSNDALFGFLNDHAWHKHVLQKLASDLGVSIGNIYWCAGSLHVYERHFYLVDHFSKTEETAITSSRYRELYPQSRWTSKIISKPPPV